MLFPLDWRKFLPRLHQSGILLCIELTWQTRASQAKLLRDNVQGFTRNTLWLALAKKQKGNILCVAGNKYEDVIRFKSVVGLFSRLFMNNIKRWTKVFFLLDVYYDTAQFEQTLLGHSPFPPDFMITPDWLLAIGPVTILPLLSSLQLRCTESVVVTVLFYSSILLFRFFFPFFSAVPSLTHFGAVPEKDRERELENWLLYSIYYTVRQNPFRSDSPSDLCLAPLRHINQSRM